MDKNNKNIKESLFQKSGVVSLLALIILLIIMTIANRQFLSFGNIVNISRQIAINGIVAAGMTFVILTGGIDLSVGAIMALTGTAAAACMINYNMNYILAIIVGLIFGLLFGLLNGFLVSFLKIPAIIATLATQMVARGLALIYTGGYPMSGLPKETFGMIGNSYILGVIPTPFVILVLVYIVSYMILNKRALGRYIYALGGNEEAVRLSGINLKKTKLKPFIICGLFAAIAGIIATSRLLSGQPNSATGAEMDAIAAVVLGGTSIAGGKGHIFGSFIGAVILGVISNGLNFMGATPYVQMVFKGVIIIFAIYASSKQDRK